MKTLLTFIASLLFTKFILGQNRTDKPQHRLATEKEQAIFDRSQDCIKHTTLSFAARMKNYPFSIASQIQLVSFRTSNNEYKDSLPRENDTICYSKLYEVKNLTYTQVDELTDVLYDYGYRSQLKRSNLIYTERVLNCYNPRNAILFLDSNRKVFEFIEICFECERMERSSNKINMGIMCNQKLILLKHFFKGIGIGYGVTKE